MYEIIYVYAKFVSPILLEIPSLYFVANFSQHNEIVDLHFEKLLTFRNIGVKRFFLTLQFQITSENLEKSMKRLLGYLFNELPLGYLQLPRNFSLVTFLWALYFRGKRITTSSFSPENSITFDRFFQEKLVLVVWRLKQRVSNPESRGAVPNIPLSETSLTFFEKKHSKLFPNSP